MSPRPARLTQADLRRIIRAAKQEGAAEIEVRLGSDAAFLIKFSGLTNTNEPEKEIIL